jgi:hypothetical protein
LNRYGANPSVNSDADHVTVCSGTQLVAPRIRTVIRAICRKKQNRRMETPFQPGRARWKRMESVISGIVTLDGRAASNPVQNEG